MLKIIESNTDVTDAVYTGSSDSDECISVAYHILAILDFAIVTEI